MNEDARTLARVYAALWAVLVAAWATASAVPGVAASVRSGLDLEMADVPSPALGVAVVLVAHNASIALWPLAAIAVDLHRWRLARLLDLFLLGTLVANAAIIGMAIAAYGARLLPFVPHLPLELLGLALPASAWAAARRSATPRVAKVAGGTMVVLSIASGVEAYAT